MPPRAVPEAASGLRRTCGGDSCAGTCGASCNRTCGDTCDPTCGLDCGTWGGYTRDNSCQGGWSCDCGGYVTYGPGAQCVIC